MDIPLDQMNGQPGHSLFKSLQQGKLELGFLRPTGRGSGIVRVNFAFWLKIGPKDIFLEARIQMSCTFCMEEQQGAL